MPFFLPVDSARPMLALPARPVWPAGAAPPVPMPAPVPGPVPAPAADPAGVWPCSPEPHFSTHTSDQRFDLQIGILDVYRANTLCVCPVCEARRRLLNAQEACQLALDTHDMSSAGCAASAVGLRLCHEARRATGTEWAHLCRPGATSLALLVTHAAACPGTISLISTCIPRHAISHHAG